MSRMETTKDTKRNLPAGWRWARLGEVCRFTNGNAYRESDWSDSGTPIIRIQNLNDTSKPFNYWAGTLDGRVCVRNGDLLLAWSGTPGTSFGAHIWEGILGVLNQHIFLVHFSDDVLDARWAKHSINHALDDLIRAAHGAVGLAHVTRREVDAIEIPLPPLSEQRRIAGVLREQMTAVEKARMAAQARLEAVKTLPASFLRQVFPQPGQPLPDGWRWVRLREVADRIDYGYTASADVDIKAPKFLRITDIQDGRVNWDSVPGCAISDADEDANRLEGGDIVFARTGATTGKSYLISNPPRSVFASYLIRVKSHREHVEPDYLFAFFQSGGYWEQILAGARGGAQPGFNATMLTSLRIPLPPIEEQRRIARLLGDQMAAVEKARAASEEELQTIDALPAALLRRAFNGEI